MLDTAKIRKLREALGLSLSQAAARAEFKSRQQWHRIETGAGKGSVTMRTLARIAEALEQDPADLLLRNESLRTTAHAPLSAARRGLRPQRIGYIPALDHAHMKKLRIARHLTVQEAAEQADITSDEWWQMEAGKRPTVTLGTLAKLARVLCVDPRDLLAMPSL